jgi:hypothetical protein
VQVILLILSSPACLASMAPWPWRATSTGSISHQSSAAPVQCGSKEGKWEVDNCDPGLRLVLVDSYVVYYTEVRPNTTPIIQLSAVGDFTSKHARRFLLPP